MIFNHARLRNKILQIFYRPGGSQGGIFAFPEKTLSVFDELDARIEEKITPLLSDLFE